MDLVEEFVFNDADGSDEDLRPYEYGTTSLFMSPVNHWEDDIFIVDSTEGGYITIFDSKRENLRYSVLFSHRIDDGRLLELIISTGKSYDMPGYKPTKRVSIPGKSFPYDYTYFLELNEKDEILLSSISKFRRLAERFLNLGVFL